MISGEKELIISFTAYNTSYLYDFFTGDDIENEIIVYNEHSVSFQRKMSDSRDYTD